MVVMFMGNDLSLLDLGRAAFSVPVSHTEFRKQLKKLALSQSEVARRLYVEVRTVQRWASGERSVPGPVIACLEAWMRQAEAEEALKRVKKALDR